MWNRYVLIWIFKSTLLAVYLLWELAMKEIPRQGRQFVTYFNYLILILMAGKMNIFSRWRLLAFCLDVVLRFIKRARGGSRFIKHYYSSILNKAKVGCQELCEFWYFYRFHIFVLNCIYRFSHLYICKIPSCVIQWPNSFQWTSRQFLLHVKRSHVKNALLWFNGALNIKFAFLSGLSPFSAL